MAKKWSERTEAALNEFLQDPAYKLLLQPVLQRHPDADQDEIHLFEAIGEDLASEQEAEQEEALWALIRLMPEIDEDLYIRKKSQNNIFDHLIQELVKKRRFSTKKGKDPRPLVKKVIDNWEKDGKKREHRIMSLDNPPVAGEEGTSLRSTLPDPTIVEDEVVDRLLLEQFSGELDFLNKNEKFVIIADIDNWSTREIAEELGISEGAVRHLKSRTVEKIKTHATLVRYFASLSFIQKANLSPIQKPASRRCMMSEDFLLPWKVSKRDYTLSFRRQRLLGVIGLCQFLRRKMAMLHTKRLRE